MIGGIEAGGTKFVCAVGDEKGDLVEKVTFPTREPKETLNEVKNFFDNYDIVSLGVGTFGPVDLNQQSQTYGTILNTPKTQWRNYNLLNQLKSKFQIPIYIDTDVNVACLGEYKYGAGKDVDSCLYITVGTGIGAGFVKAGKIFQGVNHPEMGHIFIQKHENDLFEGACPYHGTCLEGLASGSAIEKRYGKKGALLVDQEDVWELESYYLAQAMMNYYVILSPERIILGGGVMKQEKLYSMVRKKFIEMLNDYWMISNVDSFIVAPGLGDEAGIRGVIELAASSMN